MAKPGQPVDEEGKPTFPSAAPSPEDDVQGHLATAVPTDDEEEEQGGPQLAV